ncbi:hypothetical protein SELMODRAFT_415744 [Selaginella moellendorffii]|uniref:Uncharacterized protein n=1 Tax=Selaginella moellendorffii TaxID=88036 RepID=D8RX37_SELML|nr:uncharacterized protein LOC9645287 [Selaginella moellendorffii]XP_002975743.1 uncharacterized protein LOC9645289 [Selaginella moellendorffii]EFJ23370.1 hypothetical protein SELMODRAFT_415742 [Selaginella moellendorffii]EFJ23372.1 hypothetical protein SELMODRAFT_415744 [Selaginella moellendorffii]|eukprot:XP_002975741.1 uncharacterized protein LOC9645287 [Selaginella moellendorffii]
MGRTTRREGNVHAIARPERGPRDRRPPGLPKRWLSSRDDHGMDDSSLRRRRSGKRRHGDRMDASSSRRPRSGEMPRSRSPKRRRSSRGDASPRRPCTEEKEEATGWVPIPGKLHPSGLDEVEAMKYGFFPVRNRAPPLDEDGKTSDIFVCDKAAYQMLNDAHLRGTELGAWVAKRLRLGALFVHHNYDQVPGWRVITLFGRLKAMLPTRGKKVIPEWLKLHGQQDDAECVESAQLFAEAATDFDVDASCFRIVFVCGNTKFVELLRKDHAGLQQLFVERRAVDRTRDVPFRVWHITSQSCSQLEEECLDESLQDFAYQSGGWEYLRGIVRKYH